MAVSPLEPPLKRVRKDILSSELVQRLGDEELDIQVVGVGGDGFQVRVPKSLTCSELRRIIRNRLPLKAGARVVVMKGSQKLSLSKTLAQEGLVQEDQEEPTSLSYAYEVANLQEALRCIRKCPVDADESMALEGILQLRGLQETTALRHLVTLKHLAFGDGFNDRLEGVAWPRGLQSLSFGFAFDQSLEGVAWPCSLQSLSFGEQFNQSLRGVAWPSGLQSLSFGFQFNQSLEGVAWPSGLQSLSFGFAFNQSLEGVAWPSGLQSLSFGEQFNQSLEGVAFPNTLKSLSFGRMFDQSLERTAWPSGLQSIEFVRWFDALKRVNWPSSLQCLVVLDSRSEVVEMDLPRALQRFECLHEDVTGAPGQWMISTSESDE